MLKIIIKVYPLRYRKVVSLREINLKVTTLKVKIRLLSRRLNISNIILRGILKVYPNISSIY